MSFGEPSAACLDAKPDLAVIDEQIGPRTQRLKDFGMRQRRAASVPGLLVEINAEGFAGLKPDRALGESAQPQLWALQIGKDTYRASRGALDFADHGEAVFVILMGPVAEV